LTHWSNIFFSSFAKQPADEEANGFPCNTKCPGVIIPSNHLKGVDWMNRFMTPIATIIILITLGMQLYRYKKWFKWPNMWITIDGFAKLTTLAAALFVVCAGGYPEFGCEDQSHDWHGNHPAATAQNWVLYIGSWSTAVGYAIIATNVLLSTLRPRWLRRSVRYLNVFYFVSMWIFPIIILICWNALNYTG